MAESMVRVGQSQLLALEEKIKKEQQAREGIPSLLIAERKKKDEEIAKLQSELTSFKKDIESMSTAKRMGLQAQTSALTGGLSGVPLGLLV